METPVSESPGACILIEKDTLTLVFSWNFAKFLRIPIL